MRNDDDPPRVVRRVYVCLEHSNVVLPFDHDAVMETAERPCEVCRDAPKDGGGR